MTLPPEKFAFYKREVEFVGFKLVWDVYGPVTGEMATLERLLDLFIYLSRIFKGETMPFLRLKGNCSPSENVFFN